MVLVKKKPGRAPKEKPITYLPDGKPVFGFNEAGTAVCHSRLSDGVRRCMSPFTMKNGRCRMHGGNMPAGFQHHNTKTAIYSKSAPERIGARMAEIDALPDRYSMGGEITLLASRVSDLLNTLENGLDKSTYERLIDSLLHARIISAQELGSASDTVEILDNVIEIAQTGVKEFHIWREIRQTVEILRRTAETEAKLWDKQSNNIALEDVAMMVAMLKAAVQKAIVEAGAYTVLGPYKKYMAQALEAKGAGRLTELFKSVNDPSVQVLPEPENVGTSEDPILLPDVEPVGVQ